MKNGMKNFFQKNTHNFQVRYDRPSWIDKMFRKSIFMRLEETMNECKRLQCKNVLDIGCGYGFQARCLAKNGIDVLGIDLSENMIRVALQASQANSGGGKLEFKCMDFSELISEKKYDAVMALGLFDYIKDPAGYLIKIKGLISKCAIISFPAREDPLAFQRKMKYSLFRRCPLYFYSRLRLEALMKECSITDYVIKRIARDYILKIYANEKDI